MKRSKTPTKRPHLNEIRTTNRARILELLLQCNKVSRKDLGLRLDLTNATISRITKELIAEGVCIEGEPYRAHNQLGRYQTDIYINPERGLVIAICISSLSSDITINDLSGKVRHHTKIPLKIINSPESTVKFISNYVKGLVKEHPSTKEKILGTVLSIPGSINVKTGHLINSPIIKWKDFAIGEQLNKHLSCPIRVENIADTLCLNHLERNSLNDDHHKNIFVVHVAIGMGASLAIDGRIVRQRGGNEGLIGNIPVLSVLDPSAPPKRLNQISSGRAILQEFEGSQFKETYTHADIKKRFQLAVDSSNNQEGKAHRIFLEAGQTIGSNLMALTAACTPDVIILSGPAMGADSFSEGIMDAYRKTTKGTEIETTEFLINKTTYIEATKKLALREYLLHGNYAISKN